MNELSPYSDGRPSPSASSSGEATTVLSRATGKTNSDLDLSAYWRILRKRRWLIAACMLGTLCLTVLFLLQATPLYTAGTTLLIERRVPQVLDVRPGFVSESFQWDEYDYYRTQYEILRSQSLAAQVIRQQGLEKHPLFAREGQEQGKAGLLGGLWSTVKAWAATEETPGPPSSAPFQTAGEGDLLGVESGLVASYLDLLAIEPVQRTRLVRVAFHTPDPELSARLANAHAASYIRQGLELRSQASGEARKFLEEKLVELKERLEKSEAALNSYRRDKQIISLDDKENIVVERLADLNQRLTQAEAERIALEAQVRLIRKRDYDFLPDVIKSTLIQTLKEQVTRLEGEHAHLATEFRPGYPPLDQLKAQVDGTRRRLDREIQNVVKGIESAYLAAATREKELRAKMEEQKAATLRLKDASVEYAILNREVDTNRQLYDTVLQRMKEVEVAQEIRASNVSIIDRARTPLFPSRPKKRFSLMLGTFLGLLGGVGLAFFVERLDNTLKTPEEVEQYLHLPNLGVVPDFVNFHGHNYGYGPQPALSKTAAPRPSPRELRGEENDRGGTARPDGSGKELVLAHHPLSLVTEAYRVLRTSLLFARAGEPSKTILFTSGTRAEGKTATTVNTAIIFAKMGARVVVVDADLRRPRCHKILGMANTAGLTDLLTGQRDLEAVIRPTPTERLFLISRGESTPNPAELVGSQQMYDTLAALQEHFDYVLIDSPPVMPVNDGVLLSTMVDGVVLVVGGQQTPKRVVKETQARLQTVRAKILGVVLNRVNIQSGDYTDYYHHYYSYYGDATEAA